MVSFSNQTANVEGVVAESIPETAEAPSQFTKDARHLFRLARDCSFDELQRNLHASTSDIIRNAVDDSMNNSDEELSLLHVVVTCSQVPVEIVETILELTSSSGENPSMATIRNHVQQTPLHLTIYIVPERTDIVRCLLRIAPETAHFRDALHLRPIDIMCQKIIMVEEVIKYSHQNRDILDQFWETVNALAQASCCSVIHNKTNNHNNINLTEQQPIVHACLMAKDFPFALTNRAIKRYGKQLRQPNSDGDLPLHVIAKLPPPPKGEEEDVEDFLEQVVSLYPAAAAQLNRQGQTPLVLAVESGRKWHSGIARLLEAHPAGIDGLRVSPSLYPVLFERLWQSGQTCTLYGIIQEEPELFIPCFQK